MQGKAKIGHTMNVCWYFYVVHCLFVLLWSTFMVFVFVDTMRGQGIIRVVVVVLVY